MKTIYITKDNIKESLKVGDKLIINGRHKVEVIHTYWSNIRYHSDLGIQISKKLKCLGNSTIISGSEIIMDLYCIEKIVEDGIGTFEKWLSDYLEIEKGALSRHRYLDADGDIGYDGLSEEGFAKEADGMSTIALQAWLARGKVTSQ